MKIRVLSSVPESVIRSLVVKCEAGWEEKESLIYSYRSRSQSCRRSPERDGYRKLFRTHPQICHRGNAWSGDAAELADYIEIG